MSCSRGFFVQAVAFVACAGVVAFQIVKFISDVNANPIATVTDYVPVNSSKFQTLMICLDPPFVRNVPQNFPLGFFFTPKTSIYIPKGFSDADFESNYTAWEYLFSNYTALVDAMQAPVYDITTQVNKADTDIQSIRMEPAITGASRSCGLHRKPYGRPFSGVTSAATMQHHLAFYFSTIRLWGKMTVSVGLYDPDSTQFVAQNSILAMQLENVNLGTVYMHLSASITKFVYLNRRNSPCTTVKNDDQQIYPAGYLQTKCNTMCLLQAVPIMHNCTPIQIYNASKATQLPACHDHYLRNHPAAKPTAERAVAFAHANEKCRKEMRCEEQRYCTEWDISLKEAKPTSTNPKTVIVQGKTRWKISIAFESRYTVVQQYYIYTTEVILGSIGGIFGIWIGLSVFGVCASLASTLDRINEKERRVSQDGGDQRETADQRRKVSIKERHR